MGRGVAVGRCPHGGPPAFHCEASCRPGRWRAFCVRRARRRVHKAVLSAERPKSALVPASRGREPPAISDGTTVCQALALLRRVADAKNVLVVSPAELEMSRDQLLEVRRRAGGHFRDAEQTATFGCLLCIEALYLQHFGREHDFGRAFVEGGVFLEEVLGSGRATTLDWMVRRFCMVSRVFSGRILDAIELGEECVRLDRSSVGSWIVLGDILNRAGEMSVQMDTSDRSEAFRRASRAYKAADAIEVGHKRVYRGWVFALSMLDDMAGCRLVAEQAIRSCSGFWVDPMQRPPHMVVGIASKPWYKPEDFAWVRRVEENWESIRIELETLEKASAAKDGQWIHLSGMDATLTAGTGNWPTYPILGVGAEREDMARRQCPFTHKLLSEIESVRAHAELRGSEETAIFSRLRPGMRLRPHCGPTNTHLTCHLGLRAPAGYSIRVGSETRTWSEGRCIIFDDSFEHEVLHDGDGDADRVVLLIRFWHPDVRPSARAAIVRDDQRYRKSKAWILL